MDGFLHIRVDKKLINKYKQFCKRRKISVSDDIRTYMIMSTLMDDPVPAEKKFREDEK